MQQTTKMTKKTSIDLKRVLSLNLRKDVNQTIKEKSQRRENEETDDSIVTESFDSSIDSERCRKERQNRKQKMNENEERLL